MKKSYIILVLFALICGGFTIGVVSFLSDNNQPAQSVPVEPQQPAAPSQNLGNNIYNPANASSLTGILGIADGGTATSTQVINGVNYFDGTHITSGTSLTWTGSNFGIATSTPQYPFVVQGTGTNAMSYDGINLFLRGTGGNSSSGAVQIVPGASSGENGLSIVGMNSGGIMELVTGSAALRTLQIVNNSSGGFQTIFGDSPNAVNTGTGTNYVGINATSTPWGLLSIAGSAAGTTPLFVISSSTAAFATTTTLVVDSSGNFNYSPGVASYIYNTVDNLISPTNYERTSGSWGSNIFTLATQAGGSGVLRNLQLFSGLVGITISNTGVGSPVTRNQISAGSTGTAGLANFIGTFNGSILQSILNLDPVISQTSAGGYIGFLINTQETTVGTGVKDLQVWEASTTAYNGSPIAGTLQQGLWNDAGQLMLGTSTSNAVLTAQNEWGNAATNIFLVASSTNAAGTAATSMFTVANSGVISLNTVSYNSCTALTTSAGVLGCTVSDERLKEGIETITPDIALASILKLDPVTFRYKSDAGAVFYSPGLKMGLLAQEVQKVFPNIVSTTSPSKYAPNGTMQVDYSQLISPIISAIQSLFDHQTVQDAEISALQAQVKLLQSSSNCVK